MIKSPSSSSFPITMVGALLFLLMLCAATFAADTAAAAAADDDTSSLLSKMDLDDSMRLHGMLTKVVDEGRNHRKQAAGASPEEEDDVLNTRRLASCSDKLDKCRSKLESCEDKAAEPEFLFTQMANTCKLKRKVNSKGDAVYEWSSKDMDDDTYIFSDRPFRMAQTASTEDFFDVFDDMFTTDNGGKPNGAITFQHKNAKKFEGPLISIFVEAAYKTDAGKFIYEVSQSKEQEAVNALEDFFEDGDSVAEYEMCSVFLDDLAFWSQNENIGEFGL